MSRSTETTETSTATSTPWEILAVNKPDFQAWRHHPVSKALWRYLQDYRDQLRQEFLGEATGSEVTGYRQGEFGGRIKTADELAEIQFEAIAAFYGLEEGEDDDATETA